jgi:hypothetical protein
VDSALDREADLYLSAEQLDAGLDDVREAPRQVGVVQMIVRRPALGERLVIQEALLDTVEGLLGDTWRARGSRSTPDGAADPNDQVTVTSWRAMRLVAGSPERCPLAGDQLYVDLDLGYENLPEGSLLSLGSARLEVSAKPHSGCAKFRKRFGPAALRFVNFGPGGELRLRGINTRVVQSGLVGVGDEIRVQRPRQN